MAFLSNFWVIVDGCGQLWVVFWVVVDGCGWLRVVMDGFGWLCVVVDGCGWLHTLVYPFFNNSTNLTFIIRQ